MPLISAADAAEKHRRRTIAAVPDYKTGIERVTESPTAKAAASVDKWMAGIQRAMEKGKYQSGLNRVTLQDWKDKAMKKGAQRISAGVDESVPKVRAFYGEFFPWLDALDAKLEGMASNTIEDSIARATEAIRHNASFVRK